MPILLSAQPVTNWVIRGSISFLVPFIAKEMGFTHSERAMLLGAFYPGYVASHVPGGWAVQRFGGKVVLTINMVGTAVLCVAMPLAMRVRASLRAVTISSLLLCMGLFQGPLIPALQHMRKDWLPTGPGRALAMRLSGTLLLQLQTVILGGKTMAEFSYTLCQIWGVRSLAC